MARQQYDPDTDPSTGCFRNKLGITDPATLADAEYDYSAVRIRRAALDPVPGNFDFDHLKRIHQYLFQDVYEWAGRPRTVDTGRTAPFCKSEYIEVQADEIFGELRRVNFLIGLDRDSYIDGAAQLYDAMNHLHAFREGNGRANCQFHTQLASNAGWRLDWHEITCEQLDRAARLSMSGSHKPLTALIDKAVKRFTGDAGALPPALIRRD